MKIITILLYFLLACLSLSMFIIFKPFKYIDNDKSKIICNSGGSFDAGPNYIYTLDKSLDSFNDIKARKLCEFGIIRDYIQIYKTPKMNYQFQPVYIKNSSWGDVLLLSLVIFGAGVFVIKIAKKRTLFAVIFLAMLVLLTYFLYFQKKALKMFCRRQIAEKVVSFRNSAYKGGVITVPEEDAHINSLVNLLNIQCVKDGGL